MKRSRSAFKRGISDAISSFALDMPPSHSYDLMNRYVPERMPRS